MWRQRGAMGRAQTPPRVLGGRPLCGGSDAYGAGPSPPESSEAAPLCGRQKEMGMKPKFNTRKSAALIATAGLSLMLVGAGLSATFTDSGVVSQSVSVGTFQIELSSRTPGRGRRRGPEVDHLHRAGDPVVGTRPRSRSSSP